MQNTFNIHCWILYCSWNAQAYNKIQIKSLHYLSIYFQNIPIQSYIEINSASKYSESSKILNKAFNYIETFFGVTHWNSNCLIFSISTKDKEPAWIQTEKERLDKVLITARVWLPHAETLSWLNYPAPCSPPVNIRSLIGSVTFGDRGRGRDAGAGGDLGAGLGQPGGQSAWAWPHPGRGDSLQTKRDGQGGDDSQDVLLPRRQEPGGRGENTSGGSWDKSKMWYSALKIICFTCLEKCKSYTTWFAQYYYFAWILLNIANV